MKMKRDKRISLYIGSGAAIVIACLVLLFWLISEQRPVLAVPEQIHDSTVKTVEQLHRKNICPNFRVIVFKGEKPDDKILSQADIVLLRVDLPATRLFANKKFKPFPATKSTLEAFPASVLARLRSSFNCENEKKIPAIPIAVDPYILLWRNDWTGGVDGSPPQFFEELQDKKGQPLAMPLFSLSGSELDTTLAWFGYVMVQGLRDTASIENPEFAVQAIARFSALADKGWFQQGAFSYGWDDSLALITDGRAKAIMTPLSRYYGLAMPLRAKIKVGALPPLRSATQLAAIGNVLVACKTNRLRLPLNDGRIIKGLSNAEFQSAIALPQGELPANMSGPVRDLSSRTAGDAVASSSAFLIPAFLDAPLPDGSKPSESVTSSLRKAAMLKR